jgi:hypothetical protein
MNPIAWLARSATLFVSCLREIFDESAYARFLRQHKIPSSTKSYAEFAREQAAAKAHRPRCC